MKLSRYNNGLDDDELKERYSKDINILIDLKKLKNMTGVRKATLNRVIDLLKYEYIMTQISEYVPVEDEEEDAILSHLNLNPDPHNSPSQIVNPSAYVELGPGGAPSNLSDADVIRQRMDTLEEKVAFISKSSNRPLEGKELERRKRQLGSEVIQPSPETIVNAINELKDAITKKPNPVIQQVNSKQQYWEGRESTEAEKKRMEEKTSWMDAYTPTTM